MMQRVVLVPLARLFAAWLLVSPLVGRAQVADSGAAYAGVIDRAVNEFGHGNWAEAHTLFNRAHELQPSARTFRGLGIVAFELRQYLEAKTLLEQALIDARLPLVPEQQASTRALLQRIAQFVGELQISVSPDSAEATLDGKDLSGGLIPLSVGIRELVVRAPGYVTVRQSIQIEGGKRQDVHIELKPSLAVAASPSGVAATTAATGEFDAIISAVRADEDGVVLIEQRAKSDIMLSLGAGLPFSLSNEGGGVPLLYVGLGWRVPLGSNLQLAAGVGGVLMLFPDSTEAVGGRAEAVLRVWIPGPSSRFFIGPGVALNLLYEHAEPSGDSFEDDVVTDEARVSAGGMVEFGFTVGTEQTVDLGIRVIVEMAPDTRWEGFVGPMAFVSTAL